MSAAEAPDLSTTRLDFRLPQFVRLAWVSLQAKQTWEPRLSRMASAWEELLFESVYAGIRRCGLRLLNDSDVLSVTTSCAARGIVVSPVYIDRLRGKIACVAGSATDVAQFLAVWQKGDSDKIGGLLGYPSCCITAHKNHCVDQEWSELILPTLVEQSDLSEIEVVGLPACNMTLRVLGVRAVPHLPCSFSCSASSNFAAKFSSLGQDLGYKDEMDWMTEVLSWPIEWSAMHGIAEIKSPVFKFVTRADATARRHVLRWSTPDSRYPLEAARGKTFPYAKPARKSFAASAAFRRGLAEAGRDPVPGVSPGDDVDFEKNGFSSAHAMQRSHAVLLDALRKAAPDFGGYVIDLGCGTGTLIGKIIDEFGCSGMAGVDLDVRNIEIVRRRYPLFAEEFVVGNIFDVSAWMRREHYVLALLSVNRLNEVDLGRALQLLESLQVSCSHALLYDYEPLTRISSLREMLGKFGVEPIFVQEPSAALMAGRRL